MRGHLAGRELGPCVVECEACGASRRDVWSLTDITEAKAKDGKSFRI